VICTLLTDLVRVRVWCVCVSVLRVVYCVCVYVCVVTWCAVCVCVV
jgi:hypothetical protein